MSVIVHLSGYLKPFSSGETEVKLEQDLATVEAVLENLWTRHPALRDRILTEQGDIRQHVNVFVGSADVKRQQGLQTAVNSNDIHIFNAVSGG
jgi:molybdopterin converting factor small subunit